MTLFEICLWAREPVKGEKIASTPKQLRLMRRFSDTESLRTLLGLLFTISSLFLLRSPGFTKVLVMEAGVTLRPHPPVVLPSLRHPHGHVEVGDAFSSGPASGKAAFVEGPICQTRLGHELVQFVLPGRGRRAMASPAHHLQIWQRPPAWQMTFCHNDTILGSLPSKGNFREAGIGRCVNATSVHSCTRCKH